MVKITYYRGDGSVATAGHLLLAYLGTPYDSVHMIRMAMANVDQTKAANTGGYEAVDGSLPNEEYRKINPTGFVPALRIEEEGRSTIITEVPAVITYLASLADTVHQATASGGPGPNNLLGRNALERAKVYEWLAWLAGTLHGVALVEIWRPYRLVADGEAAAAAALQKRGPEILDECYSRIEQRIRDGDLGIGGGKEGYFTAVDFNLYVFWRIGALIFGVLSEESHPYYAGLMRKVEALESTRKVLEVEDNAPLAFKS
ncbi:hypothetical protein RB595_008941 [Gaeumannomyces hyphopodioides]